MPEFFRFRAGKTEHDALVAGAGPDVIRLSIGIESIKDIIEDLDQVLSFA